MESTTCSYTRPPISGNMGGPLGRVRAHTVITPARSRPDSGGHPGYSRSTESRTAPTCGTPTATSEHEADRLLIRSVWVRVPPGPLKSHCNANFHRDKSRPRCCIDPSKLARRTNPFVWRTRTNPPPKRKRKGRHHGAPIGAAAMGGTRLCLNPLSSLGPVGGW